MQMPNPDNVAKLITKWRIQANKIERDSENASPAELLTSKEAAATFRFCANELAALA